MATAAQNFTKHYDDSFSIIFTITDIETDISSYYGYWAAALTPSSSVLVQKGTNPGFNGGAPTSGVSIAFSGGINKVTVTIDQGDFANPGLVDKLYTGSFYHELTVGSLADGSDSVVISTGTMTIAEDLFNYR